MIEYKDCTIGRLVNTQESGLKVGVIVGYTRTGKVQVCKWSDNSKCWSRPQNLRDHQLYPIDANDPKLTRRHHKVIAAARDSVVRASGLVKYSGGAANAGGPPFLGAAREFSRAKDGPPVTKLAPVIGTAEPLAVDPGKRQKLQKLNAHLGAFFGFRTGKDG